MITELAKPEFYKVQHLTEQCRNIECRAIVNGVNPGAVYTDHPSEPTSALIWVQGQQGFQLVGDPQSKGFAAGLAEFMETCIEPKLKEQGIHWVEIGAEMDVWDEALPSILGQRKLSVNNQHVFCFGEDATWIESHDHKVAIHKIDAALLGARRLENHSFVEEKILHFWDSTADFLQQGLGYLAEHNNQIASVCFSAFVAGQRHAVDIETLEGYRRSHYGTAIAHALVQEFRQRGIQPYWDCMPENTGSIRIAEAVGMTLDFDYRLFWYRFV